MHRLPYGSRGHGRWRAARQAARSSARRLRGLSREPGAVERGALARRRGEPASGDLAQARHVGPRPCRHADGRRVDQHLRRRGRQRSPPEEGGWWASRVARASARVSRAVARTRLVHRVPHGVGTPVPDVPHALRPGRGRLRPSRRPGRRRASGSSPGTASRRCRRRSDCGGSGRRDATPEAYEPFIPGMIATLDKRGASSWRRRAHLQALVLAHVLAHGDEGRAHVPVLPQRPRGARLR